SQPPRLPRRPPGPTLSPYTTLCRSRQGLLGREELFVTRQVARVARIQLPLIVKKGLHLVHGESLVIADPRDRSGAIRYRLQFLRSEEHTSELQSRGHLVCRLLLDKK